MTPADPVVDLEAALESLHQSEQHLLRTVDSLRGDQWSESSVLPGWTRAHVVAHLALNAEGFARAVDGVAHELAVPVYDSNERRDADIDELAQADPPEIRERLFGAAQRLRDALASLDADQWDEQVMRVPGGPAWLVAELPGTRRREVEIHHVDLDAGYTCAEWPLDFAEHLLDAMAKRVRPPEAFEIRPHDSPRTWVLGEDEAEYPVPVVTGAAADLAWWLTGRPVGDTVSSSRGELPVIEGW